MGYSGPDAPDKFGPERRPKVNPPRAPLEVALGFLSFLGTVAIIAIAVYFYGQLPDQIPGHFNAAGQVTDYQGRAFSFFLPALAVVFFVGFSLLKRIPHLYNYPTRITPENAGWLYRQGRTLLGWVQLEGVWLFAYAEWAIVQTSLRQADAFNLWIFWGFIAAVFLTLIVYVVRMARGPRRETL